MKFDLVRLNRDGEQTLHGMYAEKGMDRGLVIRVHGLGSNFYENASTEAGLDPFFDSGFSIASLNFPGYDAAHKRENYADFVPALDAWIESLPHHETIILTGHSLGNHKIMSYETDSRARYVGRIKALSLLAPIDETAVWGSGEPIVQQERIAWLKKQVEEFGPPTIVKQDWMFWPMSAGTLLELMSPGSRIDQFAFRDGLPTLAWSSIPKYVALGSLDRFSVLPGEQIASMFNAHENTNASLIENADHDFVGNLDGLSHDLQTWINALSFG